MSGRAGGREEGREISEQRGDGGGTTSRRNVPSDFLHKNPDRKTPATNERTEKKKKKKKNEGNWKKQLRV